MVFNTPRRAAKERSLLTGNNSAFCDARQTVSLIPKGMLAKERLTLRAGGFDDPAQGWTGGYAVHSLVFGAAKTPSFMEGRS